MVFELRRDPVDFAFNYLRLTRCVSKAFCLARMHQPATCGEFPIPVVRMEQLGNLK